MQEQEEMKSHSQLTTSSFGPITILKTKNLAHYTNLT
jgi:hypothetical protein